MGTRQRMVLPALDGLRAVAAAAVLLTHVAYRTGETTQGAGGAVLARLDAGVAVFFVLSGFLLYRPHATARAAGTPAPSLRRYALRRAARILPAYWAVLAVAAGYSSVPLVTHLWLGQTYAGRLAGPLTQTWSLCTELAFYAALPVLAALARRWEVPVLAGCAVLAYGWIAAVHLLDLPDRMLLWLPGHLDWFAAGMAVAALAARGLPPLLAQLAAWPGTCWATAGALLLVVTGPVAGPLTLAPVPGPAALTKEAAYAVVATLLLLPAALGPQRGPLASAPMRWLGRISYGVFLWHLIVLDAVYRVTGIPDFGGRILAVTVLTAAGAVAAGAASWALVERPALRLADRLARRPPAGQRRGEHAERRGGEQLAGAARPDRPRRDRPQQARGGQRAARAGGPPAAR